MISSDILIEEYRISGVSFEIHLNNLTYVLYVDGCYDTSHASMRECFKRIAQLGAIAELSSKK